MRTSIALALSLAALLFAGCADDTAPAQVEVEEETTPSPAASPTPASESVGEVTSEPQGGDVIVEIDQFRFRPADVTVRVGETVAWPNLDRTTHTVTFDDGPDSGSYGHEETYRLAFDEPGTYSYICAIHPYMEGTVDVEE